MNTTDAKFYLPLVQALADGKTIQLYTSQGGQDLDEVRFMCPAEKYRIKPEPREFYMWRDAPQEPWTAMETPPVSNFYEVIRAREID